jgi:predicted branched-subunit amino acid permease
MFAGGFLAMLSLWVGAIPVGIAYGMTARAAGLSFIETQLMSLTVFSATAQMSATTLIGAGTPGVVLIGTALALHAQLLLLGLAVGRQTRPAWAGRLLGAYFLTDGAYGIALAGGQLTLARLLGAGVSMFIAWNLGTAVGAATLHTLPALGRFGVDFVAPLTFLAVLVPLVRTWPAVLTALVAGTAMLLLTRLVPHGVAVLGASLVGSAAGAWWAHRTQISRAGTTAETVGETP